IRTASRRKSISAPLLSRSSPSAILMSVAMMGSSLALYWSYTHGTQSWPLLSRGPRSGIYTTIWYSNRWPALAGLEQMVNQLSQTGVCNLTGGTVDCSNSVQLGRGTVGVGASNAIAIGGGANAESSGGIAVGHNAKAVESNSIAIGAGATALSSVAVGTGAQAIGTHSTAIGDNVVASGDDSSAFGNKAQATHHNS